MSDWTITSSLLFLSFYARCQTTFFSLQRFVFNICLCCITQNRAVLILQNLKPLADAATKSNFRGEVWFFFPEITKAEWALPTCSCLSVLQMDQKCDYQQLARRSCQNYQTTSSLTFPFVQYVVKKLLLSGSVEIQDEVRKIKKSFQIKVSIIGGGERKTKWMCPPQTVISGKPYLGLHHKTARN